ncbi:hypothetical protein L486_01387 [Kwoniella mangroviensis CBS 10435]|uniref:Zn(2)-C6 fungal-type domain-containing protein n=1 Tax=Kwoniella mangroviensis CBS 10435 TaxID=1331196 RepID=A0A1B9J1R1_9TREE|nr:hypothetical protein L486_01387 [Kwoniella mangroviensis CBS 10435]
MYVVTKNHPFYSPVSPDIPPLEVILGCGDPADLLPPRKDQEDVYDSASFTFTDSETDDDLDFDTKSDQIYHDNNDNNLVNSSNSIGTTDIRQINQPVHTINTNTINNRHNGIFHNSTNSNNNINNPHQRQYVNRLMDDIVRNNSYIMNNANFVNKRDKSLMSGDGNEDDCATDQSIFGDSTSTSSERPFNPDYPFTPPTSSPTPEDDDPSPRRPASKPKQNLDANPFSTESLDLSRLPLPPQGGESSSMASKRKAKDQNYHRGSTPKAKKTGEKGVRTKVACQACRARKAKCSGGEVCSRCEQLKLSCEYEEIKRRSPSPSPRSSNRDILNRSNFIPIQNVSGVKSEAEAGPSHPAKIFTMTNRPSGDRHSERSRAIFWKPQVPHRPLGVDDRDDARSSAVGPGGLITPTSGPESLDDDEEEDDNGAGHARQFDREGKRKAKDQ